MRAAALLMLAAVFLPQAAEAQEAVAQSLYGVKEILVRPVRFENAEAARSCRLSSAEIDAALLQDMKDNNLPALAEGSAAPSTVDTARITLVPQIEPFNEQGLDCVTWVSLSAETRNHLRVLPVEIPRMITVQYWRSGEMVASAVSVHGDHVETSLRAMVVDLAHRFAAAQPPVIGHTNVSPAH